MFIVGRVVIHSVAPMPGVIVVPSGICMILLIRMLRMLRMLRMRGAMRVMRVWIAHSIADPVRWPA